MMRRWLLVVLLCIAPWAQADFISFGSQKPSFLPADQAFALNVHAIDQRTLLASFKVTPGYYLYRDKVSFSVTGAKNKIARIELPKGEIKHDPNFGEMEVFHQSFQVRVLLDKVDTTKPLALNASYQGCSDQGLCYPPIEKALNIELVQTVSAAPPVIAT